MRFFSKLREKYENYILDKPLFGFTNLYFKSIRKIEEKEKEEKKNGS